jgi:hypothetical protein
MEQPRKRFRIGLIIGIAAGVFLTCVAAVLILVFVVLRATGPAYDAAESFMTALKDKDYPAAYNLCTRSLQQEVESVQNFRRAIESNRANPVSWNFTSRSVNNDQAVISGDGVFTAGRQADIEVDLQKVDGIWKVYRFEFNWK